MKLYVGNLPYNTTEDDLRTLFSQYGNVDSVAVITDRDTGRSKGFGFVEFGDDNDLGDRDEREGLTVQSGIGVAQERSWLRRIRGLADEAAREERKVERLVSILHRTGEPAVVFTEFRDSLEAIARRLRYSRPFSTLHGGLDAGERRQQLHRFLGGSTSILLATDVAVDGIPVNPDGSDGCLIENDLRRWPALIAELTEPDRARRMSAAALAFFARTYGRDVVAAQYDDIFGLAGTDVPSPGPGPSGKLLDEPVMKPVMTERSNRVL